MQRRTILAGLGALGLAALPGFALPMSKARAQEGIRTMLMPNYLEFTVTHVEAAKAFYSAAFGMEFTEYGPTYADASANGLTIGITLGEAGKPPLPGYQTDDIDAARESVIAAGGEIAQETYEFPGGRRFHFRDPAGNEALYYQADEA